MKSHTFLRSLCALVILCGALLGSSCSTISQRPALAQLAVQYATVKVLENNPGRAARVVEIATFLEENAGGSEAVSVALLEAAVRSQIKWENLSPADTVLVNALIGMVAQELTARLGTGVLNPEQALVVKEVAGWIRAAALLSQPS